MENKDLNLENSKSNLNTNTLSNYVNSISKFPLSGIEPHQYHSFEYVDDLGIRHVVRYYPTKNIMNIEKEYPENVHGPETRNVNFYLNEGRAIIQGTDYCGEDEEDYPGMGSKQIDLITTTCESDAVISQLNNVILLNSAKRYNTNITDILTLEDTQKTEEE